ncbi:hypothetical protein NM208_g3168 [Fusarium decemcellulare]|uniref:Uncharacterized protein n=1 Tax=Fusarium decemcellulare TaxID=57161 RepID=A0ACC1SQ72_9HYPO|nr:hypothetical protein NM208_g3168 [Fusarium decemcellulare]
MFFAKTFAALACLAACGVQANPCHPTTTRAASTTTTTSSDTTTSTTAAATCGINIIQNPGFDGGDSTGALGPQFTHWSNTGNTGFGSLGTSTNAHNTPYSLKFNAGAGAGTVGASQALNTVGGKLYTLSFWYYVDSSSTTSTLTCTLSYSEASSFVINLATAPQKTWTKITGQAYVGTTATTLKCQFSADNTAAILVDDFSFITPCVA